MTVIVYTLWNRDNGLIYVGQTDDLSRRLYGHALKTSWFGEVAKVMKAEFPDRRAALDAEYSIIAAENPPHNLRGTDICPRCRERERANNRRAPYCSPCQVDYQNERKDRLALPRRKPPTLICPRCQGPKEAGPSYCRDCRLAYNKDRRASGKN